MPLGTRQCRDNRVRALYASVPAELPPAASAAVIVSPLGPLTFDAQLLVLDVTLAQRCRALATSQLPTEHM